MDSASSDTVDVASNIRHCSRLTLNDIISHYNIEEAQLQRVCSHNVRLNIAQQLKDWKMMGHCLKLTDQDLIGIQNENTTEDQRRVATLNKWYEREGRNATYLRLAGALYQHGRRDLVELLCRTVKERDSVACSRNEAMFRANEENIRIKFALLIQRVRLALEENKVTIKDVRTILLGMFANCNDLIPNTNLEEMIAAVTREGLWNYMHHSPVEELLRNLLPHHKYLISQYKEHLSGYEATTTLIDYIEYTKVDSRRESCNEIPLGNYTRRHYQRLTMKLDNKRNITLLSFKYVQDLWQRCAEEFHVPSLTSLINKISRGCIEITCEEMDSASSDTVDIVSNIRHGSPTLNDIISHYNIEEEQLQRVCSHNVRLSIAQQLNDWKMLGHYLKLTEPDLTAIQNDNTTEDQRRVATLNKWHEREGRNATYLMLAGALYQRRRRDLVESLCHTVKEGDSVACSRNEDMFRTNEKNIRSKFALLIRRVRVALKENKVTTKDVRTIILGMFENSDDYIPSTNLEEIIDAVTREGLWNYMHHSPVEELLCTLLPHHKSLTSQYKEHLSGYEATMTLIDYIKYTNVDSRRESCNEIRLGDYTRMHYRQLTVKLDNKRNITLLSLKYVQDLWQRFAEEFHIPSLTALINKISSLRGCIEITWLVPPTMAKKIAESANKSIQFFRENNIVQVALDDNPVYDQLEVVQSKANFKENLGKGIEEVDLHTPEVRHLRGIVRISGAPSSPKMEAEAERIATLQKQFRDLHQSLLFELTEGEGISATKFFHALEMLPMAFRREYQDTIHEMTQSIEPHGPAKVTTEIFLHYSPIFTFIDYRLLKHLISEFGKPKLKERMASHVAEVEQFKKDTTVADVMDIWPGNTDIHLNYTKLRAKFKDDPRTYKLEKLDEFRRKFCSKLQLSEFIFWLISMEPGKSFFVIWCIPTAVVPEFVMNLHLIEEEFYIEENVLSLSLTLHEGPLHVRCMEHFASRLNRELRMYGEKKSLDIAAITDSHVKVLVDQHINYDHAEHNSTKQTLSYVVFVKSDATVHSHSVRNSSASKTLRHAENKRLTMDIAYAGLFFGLFAGLVAILFAQEGLNRMVAAILAGALAAVITAPIIHCAGGLNNYHSQEIGSIVGTVLAIVFPLAAIVALIETTTAGNYVRGALVGMITSFNIIAKEFNTQAIRSLFGTAKSDGYYVLLLLPAVLDVTNYVSLLGAAIGGSVATSMTMYIIISRLTEALPDISRDTVGNSVNKFIITCVFIGATVGALGVVNGAITGAIMGAIMAKVGGIESFGIIHPHSIAVRIILGALKAIVTILAPITGVMSAIIPRQSAAQSEMITGATIGTSIGAITGAFAGVTGGAFVGIIIAGLILEYYYCLRVTMVTLGELELTGARTSSVHSAVGRKAGKAIDKNCCLILVGILIIALSAMVGASTGGYLITSALNGTFGALISWLTRYMAALIKICSSAFIGGIVGTIIGQKLNLTKAANNTNILNFVLGIIGAVSGIIIAKETIGFSFWQNVGIPVAGVTLGGISGFITGFLLGIAIGISIAMDLPTEGTGGIKATISAMIGGFAGGIIGGYFASSMVIAVIIGIFFSIILVGITAQKRSTCINVPLNDIIASFGEVVHIQSSTDKEGATNVNWVQYKISHE